MLEDRDTCPVTRQPVEARISNDLSISFHYACHLHQRGSSHALVTRTPNNTDLKEKLRS